MIKLLLFDSGSKSARIAVTICSEMASTKSNSAQKTIISLQKSEASTDKHYYQAHLHKKLKEASSVENRMFD